MDYFKLTAPCGLDCFNCPMYLANTNEKLRKTISSKLSLPKEKAVCQGCRSEKGMIQFMGMEKTCNIYQCTSQKSLSFCNDCNDFPCDYLHPLADMSKEKPHNTKVFNLCLIKKMGLENWAKEKALSVKNTYFRGNFKLSDEN